MTAMTEPYAAVDLPDVRALPYALGAEVSGVDLSQIMTDAQFEVIESAFLKHHVLVFRNQPLTDEQHLEFARRFGELEGHINESTRHKKHDKVQVFSNVANDGVATGAHPERGTLFWHTDKSYVATPSLATVLRSPAIASEGGDTLFANTHAAYNDLDADTQRKIDKLQAEHSWKRSREKSGERAATEDEIAAAPPVRHPVVRTHPVTGKKCLYIGLHASHIVGMDPDDGAALLSELERQATDERYVYRHKWQVNDVLIWDNRATLHCVTPYDAANERRSVHRVVVRGDTPF